jgi:hypothetical protein
MAIKDSRKETRGCTFQPTISPWLFCSEWFGMVECKHSVTSTKLYGQDVFRDLLH